MDERLWITAGLNQAEPTTRYLLLGISRDGDAEEAEVVELLDRSHEVVDGLFAVTPEVLSADLFEEDGTLTVTLLTHREHLLEVPVFERSAALSLDDVETAVVVAVAHDGTPTLEELTGALEAGEGRLTLISRRRD